MEDSKKAKLDVIRCNVTVDDIDKMFSEVLLKQDVETKTQDQEFVNDRFRFVFVALQKLLQP